MFQNKKNNHDAFRMLEQAAADARIRFMLFGDTRPHANAFHDGDARWATEEEIHRAASGQLDEPAQRPADPRHFPFETPEAG